VARAELPALAHSIYLNTGGLGPTPRATTAEVLRLFTLIGEHGNDAPAVRRELLEAVDQARATVARVFGVAPETVAMLRAVSEGLSAVGHGLDWREGDEVVVTEQEHHAGLLPWLSLRDRFGLRVRQMAVRNDRTALLDDLAACLGPRTRLVALSHVTTETGVRLPAREVCDLVHRRCPGALVGFDGAQAAGQFPIDLAALDCDFYSATGYKWLLGHHGTSFLYVHPRLAGQLRQSWSGPDAARRVDRETLEWEPRPAPICFEFGGRHRPLYAGLARAVEFVVGQGLAAVEQRVARLAGRLKSGLAEVPGVTAHTPADPALSTGIVTAGLDGWTGSALIEALRARWQITGRSAHLNRAVRFSVAFFTTDTEVDAVVDGVRILSTSQT
jgi:selenocysteine lyase/cysteine desulfurase